MKDLKRRASLIMMAAVSALTALAKMPAHAWTRLSARPPLRFSDPRPFGMPV